MQTNDYSQSPFWTADQVAARWGCSGRTVRDLLLKGELNGFKLRNAWRVPLDAVIAYEERKPAEQPTLDETMRGYQRNAVVTRI